MRTKRAFSGRALVSSLTLFSWVVLMLSGAILFMSPPGRVANWTGWAIWGLSKQQWASLHIIFSWTFVLVGVLHLYLNWRPMISYFKSRRRLPLARPEWMAALALSVVAWLGALGDWPVFDRVLAWNETLKASWEEPARRAPVAHAELLTLAELAEQSGHDMATMRARLQAAGVKVDSDQAPVEELAQGAGLTPQRIFELATGQTEARGRGAGRGEAQGQGYGEGRGQGGEGRAVSGGGYGRMTLAEICEREGLDLEQALGALRREGIEADPNVALRDLAREHGLQAPEIVEMIGLRH